MWAIFKVCVQFVTMLLLLYILVFWLQGMCETLVSWSGSEPATSALEDKVLTTGPPENSPSESLREHLPCSVSDLGWCLGTGDIQNMPIPC